MNDSLFHGDGGVGDPGDGGCGGWYFYRNSALLSRSEATFQVEFKRTLHLILPILFITLTVTGLQDTRL